MRSLKAGIAMPRSVLRAKGQITLASNVGKALHVGTGDDVAFVVTEEGVPMKGPKTIPANQAWFWTDDWQAGEREASDDIAAGRYERYESSDVFVSSLVDVADLRQIAAVRSGLAAAE